MIVLKFGGTSVSTVKNIKTIGDIVHREMKREPVIVVSALSGVTDLLLSLLKGKEQQRTLAQIRSKHIDLAVALWGQHDHEAIDAYLDQRLHEVKQLLAKKQNLHEKTDAI